MSHFKSHLPSEHPSQTPSSKPTFFQNEPSGPVILCEIMRLGSTRAAILKGTSSKVVTNNNYNVKINLKKN